MELVFTLLFTLLIVSGPVAMLLGRDADMNDRDRQPSWPGTRV